MRRKRGASATEAAQALPSISMTSAQGRAHVATGFLASARAIGIVALHCHHMVRAGGSGRHGTRGGTGVQRYGV